VCRFSCSGHAFHAPAALAAAFHVSNTAAAAALSQSNACDNSNEQQWFVDQLTRLRPLVAPQFAVSMGTLSTYSSTYYARLKPLNGPNQTFVSLSECSRHRV
jgi:hypothetical protein